MIDSELKDKLMTALQNAVDDINHGKQARCALAKAATDSDFNVQQSRRLCELFNTSRTLYHFEKNPQNKEAEFELVDADDVLCDVFTDAATAPKIASDTLHDYSEYDSPELMSRDGMVTQAEPELWPKVAEELPSLDMQARSAGKIINTQLSLAKQAQSEVRQAEIIVSRTLSKLAAAMVHDSDYNGINKCARFLKLYDDPEHAPIVSKLSEYLPKRVKLAHDAYDGLKGVFESRDLGEWKKRFDYAYQLTKQASHSKAIADMAEKEAYDFESNFMTALGIIRQDKDVIKEMLEQGSQKRGAVTSSDEYKYETTHAPRRSITSWLEGNSNDDSTPPKSQKVRTSKTTHTSPGEDIASLLKGTASPVGAEASRYISDSIGKLRQRGRKENVNMTERLKNQQREVLLQELMTNDPYISDADPQAVANGYLAVMQLAPEVSTNKEVVRAILRQLIHSGGLGTFDASSLAGLEKTIKETKGKLPARNNKR